MRVHVLTAENASEAKTDAQKNETVNAGTRQSEQVAKPAVQAEQKSEPVSTDAKSPSVAREVTKAPTTFAKLSDAVVKNELIAPLFQRNETNSRAAQPATSTDTTSLNPARPVDVTVQRDFDFRQNDTTRQETRSSERAVTETARPETPRSESATQDSAKVTQNSEPIRETAMLPKQDFPHVLKSEVPWREIQARVEQALEQSRRRIVEPDHLNLSFFTHELGIFEIDIVREQDKLSIRVGGDAKVVTMMEEEKFQLVQWMREQGYQVERVEFASKGETASAFHRESPQQNQEQPEQLARGSARQANSIGGETAELGSSTEAPKPQVFGQRVWTA